MQVHKRPFFRPMEEGGIDGRGVPPSPSVLSSFVTFPSGAARSLSGASGCVPLDDIGRQSTYEGSPPPPGSYPLKLVSVL